MSRKPQTPNDDEKPAGSDQVPADIPVGYRFSGNSNILEIEQELLADGVELPNRAIPIKYHAANADYDKESIKEIIKTETEKDHPNRQLIGYLNTLKSHL